uniref:3'-5' exonuclease domain-containing protein n=1 Tax=viral metagenome TaxID=1070528 RepID=A0A6C0LRR7_9ZZZZ
MSISFESVIYDEIYKIYLLEENSIDKWEKIAKIMNVNNDLCVKEYYEIIKNKDRKGIKLDYQSKIKQINEQVKMQENYLLKFSFMITGLHIMIYDMLSSDGNYYFKLDGNEEMIVLQNLDKKIVYYINMSIKNEQNVYFHSFILLYALESLFTKDFYVGMDFEYTRKQIQLAQLNFEHSVLSKSIIMMVSPNELEQTMTDNFINLIMCNKNIKKILHGSDSLDIPYLYEHMLKSDHEKIIKFTKRLIDTRYLCEYYKLNKEQPTDNKCSIYDAVYYFGVMSQHKYQELQNMIDDLPHVNDIQWNIHKMPESQVLYAQYDVIFLKYFYYKIINQATQDVNDDLGKKSIIDLYKYVLFELTQFMYLERREITFLLAKCKEEVDPINNYMVRSHKGIYKLLDVFGRVSTDLISTNPNAEIDKIMKVTYFSKSILLIIKKMTYTIASHNQIVYKDKNTQWDGKLDNEYIFDFLKKMKFNCLLKLFTSIERTLYSRIQVIV